MKRSGLDPHRPADWPVDKFPWYLERQGAEPRYERSFLDGIKTIRKDLTGFRDHQKKIGWTDAVAAVNDVLFTLDVMSAAPATFELDEVVDPYSGTRYRARLVQRKETVL